MAGVADIAEGVSEDAGYIAGWTQEETSPYYRVYLRFMCGVIFAFTRTNVAAG